VDGTIRASANFLLNFVLIDCMVIDPVNLVVDVLRIESLLEEENATSKSA
jgi:hypothetical protein